MIGVVKLFPSLKGEALFEKIMDGADTHLPEKKSYRKWRQDPFKNCSREGTKSERKYPKALVFQAEGYEDTFSGEGLRLHHEHLKKLHEVYNVCIKIFSDEKKFNLALRESVEKGPYELFAIKAHGTSSSTALESKKGYRMYILPAEKAKKGNLFNRLLSPNATVIFFTCDAGKGREKEPNVANNFSSLIPGGINITAPTQVFYNIGAVLTRVSERSLKVGFWDFKSDYCENAIWSNCIQDVTYTKTS